MSSRPAHRPKLTDDCDSFEHGYDPADVSDTAHATAWLVAYGKTPDDVSLTAEQQARLATMLGQEDLEVFAHLWSRCPADSLPGALWRLYAVAIWATRNPQTAAREFDAGRSRVPVMEAIAGVADPPGPTEVADMVQGALRGLGGQNLAMVFFRVAAFARVVAAGRAHLAESAPACAAVDQEVAALADTAVTLYQAGLRWQVTTPPPPEAAA